MTKKEGLNREMSEGGGYKKKSGGGKGGCGG